MVLLDLGPGPATPPWLPLLMVIVLLGLLGFLYWSMRRNLNRIDFDEGEPTARRATTVAATTQTATSQAAPTQAVSTQAVTTPASPPSPLDRGSQH